MCDERKYTSVGYDPGVVLQRPLEASEGIAAELDNELRGSMRLLLQFAAATGKKTGPRAVLADGKYSLSVVTQNDGRSQPVEMRPMGVGSFDITVSVQYRGQSAAATVKQTNYATLADAQGAGAVPRRSAQSGTLEVSSFKIAILEGDDGVNIIDKNTAVRPVVRIVDKNNLPVAGVAIVVAIAVTRGTGAEFQGGKKSVTVITDANGQAQVDIFRPKGEGSFQIQIEATVQGQPLRSAIEAFVAVTNKNPKPFHWRKREVKGSQLRNTIINLCN